jgi:hypothetical protein
MTDHTGDEEIEHELEVVEVNAVIKTIKRKYYKHL